MTTNKFKLQQELLGLLEARKDIETYNKISLAFPETGLYAREGYPKQLEFFKAGEHCKERAFMAGNRTGKTYAVCYETCLHLLGDYPDWWEGRRFTHGIQGIVAGKTAAQTKMALQEKFLGSTGQEGTGLIPKDRIIKIIKKPGSGGAVDHVVVRHSTGEQSLLYFMSYEQGREAFQGFEASLIVFDEEPPIDVYSEGITRTAVLQNEKRGGMIMLSFTPLKGISDIVMSFMPEGRMPEVQDGHRYIVQAGWEDVPHISETDKEALISKYQPYEIEARTKGIPALGDGAVYPIPSSDVSVPWFEIPEDWPRAYGFDYGHKRTAAVFAARDPNTDVIYIYDEYVRSEAEYAVHADALCRRGAKWQWGASESSLISHNSGTKLIDIYIRDYGLNLLAAQKDVELGIATVGSAFQTGRLKIFETCKETLKEKDLYHREQTVNGQTKIKKKWDDLMDALRYLMMEADHIFIINPEYINDYDDYYGDEGRSTITGY